MTKAVGLGLNGYTKNLYSGEVLTVVEEEKDLIEKLFPFNQRLKEIRATSFLFLQRLIILILF